MCWLSLPESKKIFFRNLESVAFVNYKFINKLKEKHKLEIYVRLHLLN